MLNDYGPAGGSTSTIAFGVCHVAGLLWLESLGSKLKRDTYAFVLSYAACECGPRKVELQCSAVQCGVRL